MKALLCIFCVLSFYCGHTQNKIFYSSEDVTNTDSSEHRIDKIRLPWGRLSKTIRVEYADGSEAVFGKREIWGFEKDGRKLRLYDGEIFEIVDTCAIVLYKSFSPHPVYYFSERLDSEVLLVSRRKMLKTLDVDALVKAYKNSLLARQLLYYN